MRLLLLLVLFLSVPAAAQTVPPVGTDVTFDVATWNVEHFGNPSSGPSDDGLQAANVAAVMRQAEIDLWALQEMDYEAAFNNLVTALGAPFEGIWVADNSPYAIGYGFVYNTDVVRRLEATTVLESYSFAFGSRPPLLLRADVRLPDTTVANVRVLNIHAKCCTGVDDNGVLDYDRRVAASAALKNYVDNFLAIDAPVLVLGDFNDELRSSIAGGRPSPYQNFRDDAENYTFATYPLDLANVPTFCSNQTCSSGSTLDHVLVTRPLLAGYEAGSARRYDALLSAIPQYVDTTSDHLPVYARFDFLPKPTANEDGSAPRPFALQTPYPNPFRGATTLTFSLPAPTSVRLDVFDALGRRVATVVDGRRAAGTHEATFRAGSLLPGLYIARLSADGQTATRRLVVLS